MFMDNKSFSDRGHTEIFDKNILELEKYNKDINK